MSKLVQIPKSMIITEKKNITDKKLDDFVGEKLMNFMEKIEIRLTTCVR